MRWPRLLIIVSVVTTTLLGLGLIAVGVVVTVQELLD